MNGAKAQSIYLLPVDSAFLLYAPLHGIRALVNRSAALTIQKAIVSNETVVHDQICELVESLAESHLLRPAKLQDELQPCFLGIIPTRSCNSQCRYCDFGATNAKPSVMELDLAVRAVDWYIDLVNNNGSTQPSIHFFGGEPMVAPDVVSAVVHRARLLANQDDMIPDFQISTNGQYEAKWARFLGRYFSKVILSLDGKEDDHNQHRPGANGKESFPQAVSTAQIISDSQADLCLRACISDINIDKMAEITEWFCETFNPSFINYEVLQASELTEKNDLHPPDPFSFASGFVKSRAIAARYGVELVYASDICSPQWTSCPVGRDAAIVTPDGRISSCYLQPERWQQKGLELTYGRVGKDVEIDRGKVSRIRQHACHKPGCENCFCRWSCAGGCQVENGRTESKNEYSDFCQQTRLISAATILKDLDAESQVNKLSTNFDLMKKIAAQPSDLLNAVIIELEND
jgi:uncharacterized protein